jgi:hypothetical protein
VALTYREHVFAHALLAKAHGGTHYAAFWGVAGVTKTKDRSVRSALLLGRMMETARETAATMTVGVKNGRADTTVYEWHNVITGETIDATRHGMPFSATQAKEYLTQNPNKKWQVKFAAGAWYVLGVRYSTHQEAKVEYANRTTGNSERQRGKRTGAGNPKSRAVLCVETGKVYGSQGEAARHTGARQPHINSCCNGSRKSAGGYHWEYAS